MEEPLLHRTTTTTSPSSPTTSSIINRLLFLVLIALISIWANYEASKGFEVIILNNSGDTPQGRRFDLFFVSDDRATRIVLNTSKFVERILYPDHHHPKKPVRRITLQLTGDYSTDIVHVAPIGPYPHHEFNIGISPIVMDEADVDRVMAAAVQRAMARVWLWEGNGGAPPELVGGMVECIAMMAGYGPLTGSGGGVPSEFGGTCGIDGVGDAVGVALFLKHCEGVRRGFLARLNRAMEGEWHVRMMDVALGSPSKRMCDSYLSSAIGIVNSTDAASASRELSQEV